MEREGVDLMSTPTLDRRPIGLLFSIPEDHYAAIGKVAANWAALEALVNSSLWQLSKADDEAAACLTAQMIGITRSLDALLALVRLRGGTETMISKINRFQNDTFEYMKKRNRIIHDPWSVNPSTLKISRLEISAQKRLILGFQPMDKNEILEFVEKIARHTDRFEEIMTPILSELAPLPRKSTSETAP
jgi:hypothetical protein